MKNLTEEQKAQQTVHSDETCDAQIAKVELSADGKITYDALNACHTKGLEESGWKFREEWVATDCLMPP